MENNTICLGIDISLGAHQEEDVRLFLEGEWSEDTVVSRHPGFDDPNIKVVGEIGEGGDHMFVSFKNLSNQPVTIKEKTKVVKLHARNQGGCPHPLTNEDGSEMTAIEDDPGIDGSYALLREIRTNLGWF